jgi:RNA polymerase sigma-70 factor (ECF subfamily)
MARPTTNTIEAPTSVDAFRCLYEASFDAVWSYAVSRVGRQSAEDLVSETFTIAWRRRDSLPPDPLPWLIRVARNLALELYRDVARRRSLETELQEGSTVGDRVESDIAEGVVARHQALSALARLSQKDRELLMLVAWHGLSPRQAAQALGCSRATFFVRLHRARARLEHTLRTQASPTATTVPSHPFIHHKESSR